MAISHNNRRYNFWKSVRLAYWGFTIITWEGRRSYRGDTRNRMGLGYCILQRYLILWRMLLWMCLLMMCSLRIWKCMRILRSINNWDWGRSRILLSCILSILSRRRIIVRIIIWIIFLINYRKYNIILIRIINKPTIIRIFTRNWQINNGVRIAQKISFLALLFSV